MALRHGVNYIQQQQVCRPEFKIYITFPFFARNACSTFILSVDEMCYMRKSRLSPLWGSNPFVKVNCLIFLPARLIRFAVSIRTYSLESLRSKKKGNRYICPCDCWELWAQFSSDACICLLLELILSRYSSFSWYSFLFDLLKYSWRKYPCKKALQNKTIVTVK